MVKKVLMYAQDVGGGRFMLPVVKELIAKRIAPDTGALVHPLSQPLFDKENIAHQKLEDAIKALPVAPETWKNYLEGHNVEQVFCTTSSPYRDLSNAHLIGAARDLGIPTLGIMDHWKGHDRFFKDGVLCWLPDHICCIDDFCMQMLRNVGFGADCVHVVGHPYLEQICKKSKAKKGTGDVIRILLVSQPVTFDRSFQGVFFRRFAESRFIDEIVGIIQDYRVRTGLRNPATRIRIGIRQHPKEKTMETLPEGIEIDRYAGWDDSLQEHDIFIGIDSMALVEAGLAGKQCITLDMPELCLLSDGSVPFAYARKTANLAGLADALKAAVAAVDAQGGNGNTFPEFLHDSTQRTLAVVERFFNNQM